MGFFRLLPLLCLTGLVQAADAPGPNVQRALQLVGVGLLCEQTAPLLAKDLDSAALPELTKLFAAKALCEQFAVQVQAAVPAETIDQAVVLLQSPMAQHFTELERAVGKETNGGFGAYSKQLTEKPARGARLELMQRLDTAAHASLLAALVRYEVGKTQAWITLKDAGQQLDEQTLSEQTQAQAAQLQKNVSAVVTDYMLYAYRQTPSDQVLAYTELYEQAPLQALLNASQAAIIKVFAERRAQLK